MLQTHLPDTTDILDRLDSNLALLQKLWKAKHFVLQQRFRLAFQDIASYWGKSSSSFLQGWRASFEERLIWPLPYKGSW